MSGTSPPTPKASGKSALPAEKNMRRKITGGFPYTGSPGVLERVLDKIPVSEKPAVFSKDFLGTVIGATGGGSTPIIPILKSVGLLSQTGVPTELYSQFQTEGGRSAAALLALKNGYAEIFKRNQFAHKALDAALIDIIVAVTGLPPTDTIVRYIANTFKAFQKYSKNAPDTADASNSGMQLPDAPEKDTQKVQNNLNGIQLAYNINIILPETTNIEVFNAIFKSLKGNLLGQ